ncbi:hypothetical protein TUM12149_26890 [Morganella morganii]|nr:hypothetical protein ABN09_09105 [Morganella morganii]GIZ28719.1 hypothetical protein TUM12149_26890 [Morganella morganii]
MSAGYYLTILQPGHADLLTLPELNHNLRSAVQYRYVIAENTVLYITAEYIYLSGIIIHVTHHRTTGKYEY